MKVKQLLQILLKCNPEQEIVLSSCHPFPGYYNVQRLEEFNLIINELCKNGPHQRSFSPEQKKTLKVLGVLGY